MRRETKQSITFYILISIMVLFSLLFGAFAGATTVEPPVERILVPEAHFIEVKVIREVPVEVEVVKYLGADDFEITEAELDLFARLVTSEAGGEPYHTQLAVATVVMNRVKSAKFPDTITDVIYQKNAFEVVAIGTIERPAFDLSVMAVKEALAGKGNLPYYVDSFALTSCDFSSWADKFCVMGNVQFWATNRGEH